MTSDLNLFGLLINVGLVGVVLAILLLQPLRKALARLDAYRFVWHPALVDVALFVLVWAGITWGSAVFAPQLTSILG